MPWYARQSCTAGMLVGPLMSLFVLFPILPWRVAGRFVSHAELWSSGLGPIAFSSALVLGIGCWGVAAKNSKARWFLVLWPVVQNLAFLVVPEAPRATLTINLFIGLTGAIVLYICLFHASGARRYFADGGA